MEKSMTDGHPETWCVRAAVLGFQQGGTTIAVMLLP
jgi:hypothetical protein